MTWTCKLLGHKFEQKSTETREKEVDGNTALVNVEIHECKRCDESKEEKLRTKIRNEDETEDDEDSQDEDRERSRREGTNPKTGGSFSTSSGNSPRANQAQGGVILKDKDEDEEEEDSSLNRNHEYREEEGVVMYDRDNQEVNSVIRCESCDFSRSTTETSRRSGDMCIECGGWLEVERVSEDEDSEDPQEIEEDTEKEEETEQEEEEIQEQAEIL